ncbi:hypothetical protein GCM10012288_02430 [Malaciobacter pacificus]|uniref:Uncharacterized protein n=1 Tax=Malaciobacter pacificus TaxID=1080223 RepID=A0A5C2H3F6_9BACT|nr:hypothetical protein [Malaciobacter pacificus]QEP33500.1 hypothetical protein APAC_0338 [Malaciobacter pacificus]GGD32035.1 hypothetical protein GCM10012288_02430 [Malaciobacter pacificus]
MKSPKGFGKKYFTFASILAHNVQKKLESQVTIAKKTLQYRLSKDCDELENEDPPELLLCLTNTINFNKPCHCDCLFKVKTKLTVSLFKFIPRCPYYTTCFAFRRTGVHPPR